MISAKNFSDETFTSNLIKKNHQATESILKADIGKWTLKLWKKELGNKGECGISEENYIARHWTWRGVVHKTCWWVSNAKRINFEIHICPSLHLLTVGFIYQREK